MWDWIINNLDWVFLSICSVYFLIFELPKWIYSWKTTPNHGDDDPSGNDNINRKPWDYM